MRSMTAGAREARKHQFIRRVRELMTAKGWSQSDLARAAGVGPDRISKYLAGVSLPRVGHARRIAGALGVPVAELALRYDAPVATQVTLDLEGGWAVLNVRELRLRLEDAAEVVTVLEKARRVADEGP